ncbi:MAG TPA: hypothetical protein PLP93_02820 [Nitrosomonas sp.]|nr:hypothetical protein [Nitrosomonas sp.]
MAIKHVKTMPMLELLHQGLLDLVFGNEVGHLVFYPSLFCIHLIVA